MKKRYYILIGIISYLFFTLGNVPAAKVIALLEANTNLPGKLYGVQGSLWNGSADKLIMQDQPAIDNIQWSLNPATLLLARLSGEVKGSVKEQNIIGHFSISAAGSLSASDIRARIDAGVMQSFLNLPMGELGGTFNLDIKTLEFNENSFPLLEGELHWKNAKLTLLETVDLGQLQLLIKPENENQLGANISSSKGQLSLTGQATLDEKNMYTIDLRISPEKNATDNIRQSLAMFARRQTDGSYLLKRNGNLSEFGL